MAVSDRVICGRNDARVGVDNGTRGTVRHVDGARVVIETDGGAVRELPAGYVADHVEHAYCLTGHGMQGGTVDRALVVAAPEDLTAGWSYSALSRARGVTRLLIGDLERADAARAEVAPAEERVSPIRSEVLARAARRMLIRDDEDLAVDQIAPAGREDDRALASDRVAGGSLPQEVATHRAEPIEAAPSLNRLIELRGQLTRLRHALGGLPIKPLARFDELDATELDLITRRTQREQRLAALDPPTRRLGRVSDPNGEERALLGTAIEIDERALSELRAERLRLQRELGDPDLVRSERDGTVNAITDLQCDHDRVRDVLIDQTIEQRPSWLTGTLGGRPDGPRQRDTWDQAARTVAGFRLDHDVVDHDTPLGREPSGGRERREWNLANAALERAQRQLARDPIPRHHGLDLGIG